MKVPFPKRQIVLVVDDEPAICVLVKTLLEIEGYAVLIASDAETAAKVYEQHSARIALLLTDLRMPGVGGLELADRILRWEPGVRVLFMSGSDSATRGFGCIAKPFTRAQLVGKVGEALQGLPATMQSAAYAS